MANRKRRFTIELDVPVGASIKDVASYIQDEVQAGCGARSDDDPMFDLDRNSVRCWPARNPRLKTPAP